LLQIEKVRGAGVPESDRRKEAGKKIVGSSPYQKTIEECFERRVGRSERHLVKRIER